MDTRLLWLVVQHGIVGDDADCRQNNPESRTDPDKVSHHYQARPHDPSPEGGSILYLAARAFARSTASSITACVTLRLGT